MENKESLSRREAIKLGTLALGACGFTRLPKFPSIEGPEDLFPTKTEWPKVSLETLPGKVKEIIKLTPKSEINDQGLLMLVDNNGHKEFTPLIQTQWNKNKSEPQNRLKTKDIYGNPLDWAIVLHWFGNDESFKKTVYHFVTYGFDSLRTIDGQQTRTSAHFLIGDNPPLTGEPKSGDPVGILQTQKPDSDGTPFIGAHLSNIDLTTHQDRGQYFVRSFYHLGNQEPSVHSVLQDMFDKTPVDPNVRSIGIEISGLFFDSPENMPSNQKIANVVSTVWAIMKRYNIPALNILGHNEIQLNKGDPGKQFMATIRYLVGVKALLENDSQMKDLVFGQFVDENKDRKGASKKYFDFVRDYLVITATPKEVYQWEADSKYWFFYDHLYKNEELLITGAFQMPVQKVEGKNIVYGNKFLNPEYHEGVDINLQATYKINEDLGTPIELVANGECIFAEKIPGSPGLGNTIMFKHRLPNGSEVITSYGHLDEIGEKIKVGKQYKIGQRIGTMGNTNGQLDSHLHFTVAYGATWDIHLSYKPYVPNSVDAAWNRQRFIDPLVFIEDRIKSNSTSTEIIKDILSLRNILR